jgi:UDP-N-acetylmuramoyl-tripeptide--D-alanyl-D-alanine ligase
MDGTLSRLIASVVCACFYLLCAEKTVGVLQQCGYKNVAFLRWLGKKENATWKRLAFWSMLSLVASVVTALCFSFLGAKIASALIAVPFFLFSFAYYFADRKYALKVRATASGRYVRLSAAFFAVTALCTFVLISVCSFASGALIAKGAGEWAYILRYLPVSCSPLALPLYLCLANLCTAGFENARNRKFVKRAGLAIDASDVIRVGVVGSYGKTTVKNVLNTLLSVRYQTVASPASYNTPMGVAKTVFSHSFAGAEVFIAEMGARKKGDIAELCSLVKPQYIAFTGVCAQHIQTFGNEKNVLQAKCECLSCGATVVCGSALREKIGEKYGENVRFLPENCVKNVRFAATETAFTLVLKSGEIDVTTKLLGESAVENIALSAYLAEEMGLTKEEIARGISLIEPVPHRLELTESGGVYILDDGYNANEKGAKVAIDALKRFAGRKVVVTPGIVEAGVLETQINERLGALLADDKLDKVILVGETLVLPVKNGFLQAGGAAEKLSIVPTLEKAQGLLADGLCAGDAVLFLNDLPDVY